MAGKTNTDLIRELSTTVTTHEQRLISLFRDMGRLNEDCRKSAEDLNGVDKRLAVLESLFGQFKQGLEERDCRRWALWPAILGALIGSSLTQLGNILVWWLRQ